MAALLALFTDCLIHDAVDVFTRLGDMEVTWSQSKVTATKKCTGKVEKEGRTPGKQGHPPRTGQSLKASQFQIRKDLLAAGLAAEKLAWQSLGVLLIPQR